MEQSFDIAPKIDLSGGTGGFQQAPNLGGVVDGLMANIPWPLVILVIVLLVAFILFMLLNGGKGR